MKKLSYLILLALILGLVLTGCSLLSNIGQAPATEQSGVTYLTKGLPSGLVGLWHFSEVVGDITNDSSGNDNDGIVHGASLNDGQPGFGKALSFYGDDYVNCGLLVDNDINAGMTLEAWINPASKQNGGIISNDITDSSKKGYDFFLWSAYGLYGRLYVDFGNGSTRGRTYWDIPSSDWYDKWHHVAATWNGSVIKLYSDGSKVAEVGYSGTYCDSEKNTLIGAINYLAPARYYFNGLIDEVRIWNVVLSEDQLDKVYDWAGFFRPIDNDALNAAKAGSAIPVKFSLNGDQDLNIFELGYPKSIMIACDGTNPGDEVETMTAGESSLKYDATADQYIYVWKTSKDWAGSCRKLLVRLNDGTSHEASFTFK